MKRALLNKITSLLSFLFGVKIIVLPGDGKWLISTREKSVKQKNMEGKITLKESHYREIQAKIKEAKTALNSIPL